MRIARARRGVWMATAGAPVSADVSRARVEHHAIGVWSGVLAGAIVAPLVTWFPMLAHQYPALGLPAYQPAAGIDLWQMGTLWLTALLAIAGGVWGSGDRYLALAVAFAGLSAWYRGLQLDPTHTVVFGVGALLLVGVRAMPIEAERKVHVALVALAGVQIVYVGHQLFGYDVLWGPLFGGTLVGQVQPLGTLGGVNAAAGYIAVLAPLLPLWMLPVAALVIVLGHSLGALVALVVGLLVKWRARWPVWIVVAMIACALLGTVRLTKDTQANRLHVWTFAAQQWYQQGPLALVTGYGIGGWRQRVPWQQDRAGFKPFNELWMEAHNEYLQFVIELGVIGAALLGAWLWQHRRMFAHPQWGASVVALAVLSLAWHPFHIVSAALVGLLVVGLASREGGSTCAV